MSPSISFVWTGQAPAKGNYRWASKGGRRKWRRIKDFERDVGMHAVVEMTLADMSLLRGGQENPWGNPWVTVEAFNQRSDPDGILKSLLDGLEGVCYENDRHVASTVVPKKDEKGGRLVVTVSWEPGQGEKA